MTTPFRTPVIEQRNRLFDCLNRFVRAEDAKLSDADFVEMVHRRWLVEREGYIGDVGDGVDLTECFKR